jgi:hypothetical protein
MIISASYKTDIPTFYGEWFIHRLRAGYCKAVNPYGRQVYRIDLSRQTVDGIVFWTKNAGPFLPHLNEVRDRGYPFIVQYTINGYPRALETSVVDAKRSIEYAHHIQAKFGSAVVVWRYDTILLSSLTTPEFHLRHFEQLAAALKGSSDEVVISYAQIYRKTKRNLDVAAKEHGFSWQDPTANDTHALTSELLRIATRHGFRLSICSQKAMLVPGASEARCIDAVRLSAVGAKSIAATIKGNRPDCQCFQSRDIGEYDTCPHGCVYCYAVQNRDVALSRFRKHDPDSEFLFEPENISLPRNSGPDLFSGA